MPLFNRKKIDSETEKNIITGLIVSDQYIKETYQMIDFAYFQSSYIQKVAKWCIEYYFNYEKAPFETIQDIFNFERKNLSEEESELIRMLLSDINHKYQVNEGVNVPYLVDKTVQFCKLRELEITSNNIKFFLDRYDIESAEDQITNFRKVMKLTSRWINPFDEEEIYSTFDHDNEFFRFPGVLGDFLGPFDRDWLVGLSAVFKGGKTWFAQEFGVMGILSGLRVAFFSLEMPAKQMKARLYRRFTAAGDKEGDESYLYPIFDCRKNQDGSCALEIRTQEFTLLNPNGSLPDWDKDNPYRPCSVCRKLRNGEYQGTTWFEPLVRPQLTPGLARQTMKSFTKQYGRLFKMMSYPRFSANIADIKRDLDIMELMDGFIPDIIIVDYADILKPEEGAFAGVDKEDRSWIALAQMAGERHALVVAPTQITRDAMDAKTIKTKHMARWVGKLGHVDVMMTKNQTEKEKKYGVSRIGIIAHRHKDYYPGHTVTLIEQMKLGQPHLDSEIIIEREEEEEEGGD